MHTFISIILLGLFSLQTPICKEVDQKSHFSGFLNLFESKPLPLDINRKTVFELSKTVYDSVSNSYKENKFPILKSNYNTFLPKEIQDNKTEENTRCLFRIPSINGMILIVVAKDFIKNHEQEMLKLFLISYDPNGNILDFKNLAGYKIDVEEQFCKIGSDFGIVIKQYTFKESPEKNRLDLFYLKQITTNLEIDKRGKIIKNTEQNTEGYYKGDWSGYLLVK